MGIRPLRGVEHQSAFDFVRHAAATIRYGGRAAADASKQARKSTTPVASKELQKEKGSEDDFKLYKPSIFGNSHMGT